MCAPWPRPTLFLVCWSNETLNDDLIFEETKTTKNPQAGVKVHVTSSILFLSVFICFFWFLLCYFCITLVAGIFYFLPKPVSNDSLFLCFLHLNLIVKISQSLNQTCKAHSWVKRFKIVFEVAHFVIYEVYGNDEN